MCGILCCIHNANYNPTNFADCDKIKKCQELINARGPDFCDKKSKQITDHWYGNFFGSVLWMQGTTICPQPCEDEYGNILLWNGDIFTGKLANSDDSDTKTIINSLKHSTDVISTLNEIEGPFSLVYYQKSTNFLYFGRDKLGRHSLLTKIDTMKDNIFISSVVTKEIVDALEVPAIGIFVLDLADSDLKIKLYPWNMNTYCEKAINELKDCLKIDIQTLEHEIVTVYDDSKFHSIPNNVSSLYAKELSNTKNVEVIMDKLLENEEVQRNVTDLLYHLRKSIEVRIRKKPEYCKNCIKKRLEGSDIMCNHSKIGIPFSGGVDSAIIAAIANEYVCKNESIDLINVAFERKIGSDYLVPDRITGKSTYSELLKICPERKWNFIEVDVTREEVESTLPHIGNLVHPLDTILDESLGCAVYFASKAKGMIRLKNELYESPCRILLLGMGADELFGGYMRHRTILRQKGWLNLAEEMSHEMVRISRRNLGRDDRVVSDNGRQARYPYLDDHVVKFAQSLKPWERCYPTENMPCGLGEKMLLRLIARKLNLRNAASIPKRAFQFGSRIANSKENAKDKSVRL